MTSNQQIAVLAGSMLGTYVVLLVISKRYRDDHVKMFQMKKTTLRVAVDNPLMITAHLASFLLPLFFMKLI